MRTLLASLLFILAIPSVDSAELVLPDGAVCTLKSDWVNGKCVVPPMAKDISHHRNRIEFVGLWGMMKKFLKRLFCTHAIWVKDSIDNQNDTKHTQYVCCRCDKRKLFDNDNPPNLRFE